MFYLIVEWRIQKKQKQKVKQTVVNILRFQGKPLLTTACLWIAQLIQYLSFVVKIKSNLEENRKIWNGEIVTLKLKIEKLFCF